MDGFPVAPWIAAPVFAFVLSALLTSLARRIAPAVGLVDHPDGGRKRHRAPMPVMGGAAFCTAMFAVILGAALLQQAWIADPATRRFAGSLLASAVLFCALGVIDDRITLRPRMKLLGQVLASLPFALAIPPYDTAQILGWQIPLGPAFVPCIVLWLVACSNVINLIDGLDGLAGTVGLISMLTIAALFVNQGQPAAATLALIAAGSLMGFLLHNWPPARIFMGDGGSLTIGFLIGALSIQASSKTATGLTLAVPLVLISVPVFDTCMAILRRKLNGRGIGEGDRAHIHHRLQDRGLSRRQALLTIGGLSLAMAAAALISALLRNEWAGLAICLGILSLLIVGQVFGHHETQLFMRHLQELGALLLDTSGVLQTRFLIARMERLDFRQRLEIWRRVSERVEQMGGVRLTFCCTNAEGETLDSELFWQAQAARATVDGHEWQFVYSVPRDGGLTATLTAHGVAAPSTGPQRLDDLFRLFARVCQELPLFDEPFEEALETLPLPTLEPLPADLRRAA
jgi:UDP-GlcNAc:undecaprenyl-phosphate GlcNAc-1-phosphate transferase